MDLGVAVWQQLRRAEGEQVGVLCFPELAITGYTCADLFQQSAEQVVRLVKQGEIVAQDGTVLKLQADTVCVHGDGPGGAASHL